MIKKIPNNIAQILKNLINDEFKNYNHITLDSYYELSTQNYFLELTILYENNSSYILQERKNIYGNDIIINYIPKISILKNLKFKNGYIFNCLPHSTVIKDENKFLVNLKSSVVFFNEKRKTLIYKKEIDELRWEASNYILAIKHHDSQYLRYKIYECLIDLYNIITPIDYINKSVLPKLFSNPDTHPYLSEIIEDSLSSSDFQNKMMIKLNSYGGLLKTLDLKSSFYEDEIVINFNYENLNLDLFIEKVIFKFFSVTKKANYHILNFYWERNSEDSFSLFLIAKKEIIEKEILPEIEIKLNSNIYIRQTKHISTIYDFSEEYYFAPLHKLSEYVLDMKANEYIVWNDNITIVYCIEFYLSCFINLNFSKEDFLKFNNYLSQKWQLLLLSDQEIISAEYSSLIEMYQKFEKLYIINEDSLLDNFSQKLDKWAETDSFLEEIKFLEKYLEIGIKNPKYKCIYDAILTNFSNNHKYAYLEGFLFKFFGLMGLREETKIYVTYIINRIGNES